MTEALSATPLQILHEGPVSEDEIDSLGHLSVPFYEARALSASRNLLGLDDTALEEHGIELTLVDAFMRNYREQFLGANLIVRGGVLEADATRVRFYHELVNPERDELSATFVHAFELQSTATRHSTPFEQAHVEDLRNAQVEWPEHGRSRSLDLSSQPLQLDLATAQKRRLKTKSSRTIMPDECGQTGYLKPLLAPHLPYSGSLESDAESDWVFEGPDGTRLGLADLESRTCLFSLPRSGDHIQAFSADVQIARKTVRRSHWVFDLETEKLLTAGSVVMALLDLDARRAVEISAELKRRFEPHFHPDLA